LREELRPTKFLRSTVEEFMALTKSSTMKSGQIIKFLLKADKKSSTKIMTNQRLWMRYFIVRSYLLVICK
jgi:hypothetical protein